jgi:hypothetical protein
MAKQGTPAAPNFKTIDKEAAARAQAALAGGKQKPLKTPKDAKVSTDQKGVQYTRWSEAVVIQQAYRSVTKKGLMDVTIIAKVRQSSVKENNGERVFGHGYLNLSDSIPEGHEQMNDRTNGFMLSLLSAIGALPAGGTVTGSALDRYFPSKGQPGVSSPLNGKSAIANIVQTYGPMKDQKTGKPKLGEDDEPIMEKRDNIESFLPETAASGSEE